ncbi:hypothetical protein [Levilactobacillus bambusae]|nr:hypothetical protein [Levilactobacillus bambusae]
MNLTALFVNWFPLTVIIAFMLYLAFRAGESKERAGNFTAYLKEFFE